ncbi:hypothetical protein SISNIDRAFT_460249 [Sistotremastrum niveocremeum HHB9708]|uniref:Copper-fist domain-containing protein n=2 Tax=Sistotremastraceae TaxID=3402574 RepID=A0A164NSC5_9AGAM|nr:hypothetical protein SISNIDRAFT_460249 [Sistotremastrum niveocremeum HHB9708]KZT34098.1 hypothetical protein SISSUDRAFT_1053338 [Sistotremastrum suecicum HHB10207 ss-3]
MVFFNEKKFACETCIKGHRSTACNHTQRPLFEIKKKGRPATQCDHCRELRKTKQVHVKCQCESREDRPAAPPILKRAPKPSVLAFPQGLQSEAHDTSSDGHSSFRDSSRPPSPKPSIRSLALSTSSSSAPPSPAVEDAPHHSHSVNPSRLRAHLRRIAPKRKPSTRPSIDIPTTTNPLPVPIITPPSILAPSLTYPSLRDSEGSLYSAPGSDLTVDVPLNAPVPNQYFNNPTNGSIPYWPYGCLPGGHPMMAAPMAMPIMSQGSVYPNGQGYSSSSLLSHCPCGMPCSCYGCEASIDGGRICSMGCMSCQNCGESISSAFTVISNDFTFDDSISNPSASSASLTATTSVETMDDVFLPPDFYSTCCLGKCKCPPGTCRCPSECFGSCEVQDDPRPPVQTQTQSHVVFAIDNSERERDAARGLSSENRSMSGSGVPFERTDTTRSNMSTASTKTITSAFNRARHQPLRHLKRLLPKPSMSSPTASPTSTPASAFARNSYVPFSAVARGMPFNPHI